MRRVRFEIAGLIFVDDDLVNLLEPETTFGSFLLKDRRAVEIELVAILLYVGGKRCCGLVMCIFLVSLVLTYSFAELPDCFTNVATLAVGAWNVIDNSSFVRQWQLCFVVGKQPL